MEWEKTARNLVKGASKLLLVMLVLMLGLAGFTRYKKRPIQAFCDRISSTATPEAIISDARTNGFIVFDNMAQKSEVLILNQRSPFWRFACVVRFKDGRPVDKQVTSAD